MGPPLIEVTAWHRFGTEAVKSLDVLCCQSRCHAPQNCQESSCCIRSSNMKKCSNIVGSNVTMPQIAIKNAVQTLYMFFMQACPNMRACFVHVVARVDPNLALKGDQVNFIQMCIWIYMCKHYFIAINITNLYLFF